MDWIDDQSAPLLTDLYELTMLASYVAHGMHRPATFDLTVRRLPQHRNFLVVCGVEQALHYLETLRFDDEALRSLDSLGIFDRRVLEYLRGFRFTGDVWAMPEGELAFPGEPIVRVSAPLPQAQLVESFLINVISFQTLIASKAARVAIASRGRPFFDFSLRRDHGPTAALLAARASYVGGAASTSNVLASVRYGIPPSGTMAHSYVMAFEHELDAFRQFAADFPDRTVLLIDTYDIAQGARHAAIVARELASEGKRLRAVRIDSGDLGQEARKVRAILDAEGARDVQIILSGDLDEYRIDELLLDCAPADAFGVGTQLGTSADAASLGAVYKLAVDDGRPRMKISEGKLTLPGVKQVFRRLDGPLSGDVVGLDGERIRGTRPLLVERMRGGRRVDVRTPREVLEEARARCASGLMSLPEELRSLDRFAPYSVEWSDALRALVDQTLRSVHAELGTSANPAAP